MGASELYRILRESEDRLFRVWLYHVRKAGDIWHNPINDEYFKIFFFVVMSALETFDQDLRHNIFIWSPDDESFLGKEIVKHAGCHRDRGMAVELFLGYFKTLISCIEDAVADMDVTDRERSLATAKLRRVADFAEMAAIAEWERPVNAGTAHKAGAAEQTATQATSEKILSAIFTSVGEGILLVDEDFEIVKANRRASEIYGLLEQNLIGTDIRSLTDGAGSRVLTRYFDELIEGRSLSAEISSVYVDGKTFPATVTVTRSDFDGKRYWPIIVRDDTGQRTLEKQLRHEKQQTDEMNLTLKTVMKSIEQDRKDFESRVAAKIRTSLLPSLKKIDRASEAGVRKSYLALLEEQLVSLTASFEKQLDAGLLKLTKTEIEVCRLIQAGCSSKDICDAMKLSVETVQTHRRNIRRKLALNGKKLNLHTYLMNRVL